jgi:hypothetical protein
MGLPLAWETLQRYEVSPWGWRSSRSTYSARCYSASSRVGSWEGGWGGGLRAEVVHEAVVAEGEGRDRRWDEASDAWNYSVRFGAQLKGVPEEEGPRCPGLLTARSVEQKKTKAARICSPSSTPIPARAFTGRDWIGGGPALQLW